MQRSCRDEGKSLLQKKPNEKAVTVSLHCNYSRENSVHYLRTNVRRVGRQKQKGPEPTPLITSQWRTRANLKDAGLTDWTCPSICYLPIQWTPSCAFVLSVPKKKVEYDAFPHEYFIIHAMSLLSLSFDILLFNIFLHFIKVEILIPVREDQSCFIIPLTRLKCSATWQTV